MRGKLAIVLLVGLIVSLAVYHHSHSPAPVPAPESEPAAPSVATPQLPTPHVTASAPPTEPPVEEPRKTNNAYARLSVRLLNGGELPKLDPAQLESYLAANHQNAGSLLAALRTTGDPKFLLEAMQKYPNDPRVAYAAAFRADATPEDRRQWLEALKQSDPNNSLGGYLLAGNYLKSGQTEQALQELQSASGKSNWQDYSWDFMQNSEEAFLAAGYPEAEARAVAASSVLLPELAPLKGLGLKLGDLAKSYQQAGDPASAQAALQMAAYLGQQVSYSPQQPLINTLVGLVIERNALGAMDPAAPYGNSGQTVQDRLSEIAQQRATIKDLNQRSSGLLEQMSDQDMASYLDRMKTFGELPTMKWALDKYGQH
ncbi:MAG: hypothetical protein JWR69_2747 [Pedosphaera sp.]|nr:hypothetical protein [Pedosphaera sp.]